MNPGIRAASAAVRAIQDIHQGEDAHISVTSEVSQACENYRQAEQLRTGFVPILVRMTCKAHAALLDELGTPIVLGFCDRAKHPHGRVFGMHIELVRDADLVHLQMQQHLHELIATLDQDIANNTPLVQAEGLDKALRAHLQDLINQLSVKRDEFRLRLAYLEHQAA